MSEQRHFQFCIYIFITAILVTAAIASDGEDWSNVGDLGAVESDRDTLSSAFWFEQDALWMRRLWPEIDNNTSDNNTSDNNTSDADPCLDGIGCGEGSYFTDADLDNESNTILISDEANDTNSTNSSDEDSAGNPCQSFDDCIMEGHGHVCVDLVSGVMFNTEFLCEGTCECQPSPCENQTNCEHGSACFTLDGLQIEADQSCGRNKYCSCNTLETSAVDEKTNTTTTLMTNTSTTTTTTTTTITMTTSTRTTTTTTVATFAIGVIPSVVVACPSALSPLVLQAYLPTGTNNMSWTCFPPDSGLCRMIQAGIDARPEVTDYFRFSATDVTNALADDESVGNASESIFVSAVASGSDQESPSAALGQGSTRFSILAAQEGDNNVAVIVEPARGRRRWTLLDKFVVLEAKIHFCPVPSASPSVSWQWKRRGTETWMPVPKQSGLRMTFEIASMPGEGDYTFQVVVDTLWSADFDVTLDPRPGPTAKLLAPSIASIVCDTIIDASDSYDPGGDELNFAWSCQETSAADASEDSAACPQAATMTDQSINRILAGTFSPGSYTITVIVANEHGQSSITTRIDFVDQARPMVSMRYVPRQVSQQGTFNYSTNLLESGTCAVPTWKAWWLLAVGGSSNSQIISGRMLKRSDGSAAEAAHLSVNPNVFGINAGFYKFRLTLSESRSSKWNGPASGADVDWFKFDTDVFEIVAPPEGGSCGVHPPTGNSLTTSFQLQSTGWNFRAEPPLLHRFSWTSGLSSDIASATADSWFFASDWQEDLAVSGIRLTRENDASVTLAKAEVRDSLGGTAAATVEVDVSPLVFSESMALDVVGQVARSGNAFAITSVVSAVAGAAASASVNGKRGLGEELAKSLISHIDNTGVVKNPTQTSVRTSSEALRLVMTATAVRSPSATPSLDVSKQAALLLWQIINASAVFSVEIDRSAATSMVGLMEIMLSAVGADASFAQLADEGGPTAAPLSSEELRSEQKQLSDLIMSSSSGLGDALASSAEVGAVVEVTSGGGLHLAVTRRTADDLSVAPGTLGHWAVPQLESALRGRRLSVCAGRESDEFVLQHTKWPKNPHGYAGAGCPVNIGSGVDSRFFTPASCSVKEETVASMDLKACGVGVKVENLSDNITFAVEIARKDNDTDVFLETRVCHWFEETSETWSNAGCTQVANDTHVTCFCNHLTSFTAAWWGFAAVVESIIECANVHVFSADSISRIKFGSEGQLAWWLKWPAIVFWTTMLLFAAVGSLAWQRSSKVSSLFGVSQGAMLRSLSKAKVSPAWNEAETRRQEIRASAAKKFGRKKLTSFVVCSILDQILGVDSGLDEHAMQSPIATFVVASSILFRRLVVSTSLGVWRVEAIMFRRVLSYENLPGVEQLGLASDFSLSDEPFNPKEWNWYWTHVWASFQSFHPLFDAYQSTLTVWWLFRVIAAMMHIYGMFFVTAMFLESSSQHKPNSSALCEEGDFWTYFYRDCSIAIASELFALGPPAAVLLLHQHQARYDDDDSLYKARVHHKLMRDVLMFAVCTAYIAACMLLTVTFLANVRQSDANHWLLSSLFNILLDWFIWPVVLAMGLGICYLLTQRWPNARRIMEDVSDKARAAAKAKALAENPWAFGPVRPPESDISNSWLQAPWRQWRASVGLESTIGQDDLSSASMGWVPLEISPSVLVGEPFVMGAAVEPSAGWAQSSMQATVLEMGQPSLPGCVGSNEAEIPENVLVRKWAYRRRLQVGMPPPPPPMASSNREQSDSLPKVGVPALVPRVSQPQLEDSLEATARAEFAMSPPPPPIVMIPESLGGAPFGGSA